MCSRGARKPRGPLMPRDASPQQAGSDFSLRLAVARESDNGLEIGAQGTAVELVVGLFTWQYDRGPRSTLADDDGWYLAEPRRQRQTEPGATRALRKA